MLIPHSTLRWLIPLIVLMIGTFLAVPCQAEPCHVSLVGNTKQWSADTDRNGAKVSLSKAGRGLAVAVISDGGTEDFPKARRTFGQPQNWQPYDRIDMRLRVECNDPTVHHKKIVLVFYDDKTRSADVPGSPMRQQALSFTIPVNRWIELSESLATIQRSAIRELVLYLYEAPPPKAHQYRWKIAKLGFDKVTAETALFDMQVHGRSQIKGMQGRPVGSVTTDDGLELNIDDKGGISRIAIDGSTLGDARRDCPSGLLVRDVAKGGPPVMVGGTVEHSGRGISQTSQIASLGLNVSAAYTAHEGYTEIAGTVTDTQGKNRAVTVYMAIPVAEEAWKWWDSVAMARTDVGDSRELANLETGMGYGLCGSHSKYPLGALSLQDRGGLTLAIRMDEPAVHRIAYNARLHSFYLAIDLGLMPENRADGRPLSEAPFRILVYRHDPAWGFRSALHRYYAFFPGFFTKRVSREGGWFAWGDIGESAGALEAGFGFHWGPAGVKAVKWDNAHGPLALYYIEPQTYQQTMEDFSQEPSKEQVLERLQKLVQGDRVELAKVANQPYLVYPLSFGDGDVSDKIRATAQLATKSFNYDISGLPYCTIGRIDWMHKSQWGAIFSCNLAPGIPEGRGQFNLQRIIFPALRDMEKSGAHYDGVALDSFGGFGEHAAVNYRSEHYRDSRFPLSFSAIDRRPVQVSFFTTVEWLGVLAEKLHGEKKVLMANCSWDYTPGWLAFAAPYLDIFGAEKPQFADPDFIRAITYRKPCTDMPYKPRPTWEVARHWLHAIHPGLGNDLQTMQQHAGLLQDLVAAGWEPITGARAAPADVRIERYGTTTPIYLVLHNPVDQPLSVEVRLEQEILRSGDIRASVQPKGDHLSVENDRFSVPMAARDTAVIRIERQNSVKGKN